MTADARLIPSRAITRPVLALAVLLGALLQIQGSFPVPGAGAKGLRLNLADMLLPPAGVVVLYTLAAGRSLLPRWRVPFGYGWLVVLTLMLTLALAHSYLLYGHVNSWAVTNKFAGWFVLLAYLGLGGWLALNYGDAARDAFLTAFISVFVAVLGILLALTAAGVYSMAWGTHPQMIELQGFMGNRNAYAFLAMAVLILATAMPSAGPMNRMLRAATSMLLFLLPLAIYYNGSRTFLVTAALFSPALIFRRGRETVKSILPPLLAGVLLCATAHHVHPRPVAVRGQTEQTMKIVQALSSSPMALARAQKLARPNTSEAVRLRVLQDAVALWRTHPLTGAGLGSFWDFSQKKYAETDKVIEIIDCTPLWLLTETGIAGLTVFGLFFVTLLFCLARDARSANAGDRTFLESIILLLMCFALMSLFQELLYTRFLWLIMGMALARPASVTA